MLNSNLYPFVNISFGFVGIMGYFPMIISMGEIFYLAGMGIILNIYYAIKTILEITIGILLATILVILQMCVYLPVRLVLDPIWCPMIFFCIVIEIYKYIWITSTS